MAPSVQRCIFSFARLGGLCTVALVAVGLMSNLKAFGQISKGSVIVDEVTVSLEEDSIERQTDIRGAHSTESFSPAIKAERKSIDVPSRQSRGTNHSEEILASPITHAKQAHCKGDSFFNSKGMPYYRKMPEHGNMKGSRIAVVFRGDSFRTKMKASSEKRLANQVVASESHVKYLLQELLEAQVQVDIYMATWMNQEWQKTDGIAMLKDKFEPFGQLFFSIKDRRPATQGDGVLDAIGFLKTHTKSQSADELPYEFVCILRFDVILTSSIMPLFAASSIAYSRVLYPMRDANRGYYGWKNQAFVHDTMQWVPKRYFKAFLDEVVGNNGCFAKSTDWYGGSGHGCWVECEKKRKLSIQQGFWHEGCFAVKDTHPLYYINEMRRR